MRDLETVEIINLTPHEVRILEPEAFIFKGVTPRVRVIYPPSGIVIRAEPDTEVESRVIDQFGNLISTTKTRYKMKTPLPPEEPGKLYIVSKIIADLVGHTRKDLRIVSRKFFDNGGKIIGVRGLAIMERIIHD